MDRYYIFPPRPSVAQERMDPLTALPPPPARYQQRMSLQQKRSSRFTERISLDFPQQDSPPSTSSTSATPTSSVQSEETGLRSFFDSDSSDDEDARPASRGSALKIRGKSLRRSFSFRKTARDSMNVVASGRAKLVSIGGSKSKAKDPAPVLPELPDLGSLRFWLDQTELGIVPEVEENEGQAELMESAAMSARRRRSGVEGARSYGGGGGGKSKDRWSFAGWMARK